MKLLADENIHGSIVERLRDAGHEVIAVAEMEPGIDDVVVLDRANASGSLLLTEDKDFGELVFRQNLVHGGVILARLAGLSLERKVEWLLELLTRHADEIRGGFTVISHAGIRIRRRR